MYPAKASNFHSIKPKIADKLNLGLQALDSGAQENKCVKIQNYALTIKSKLLKKINKTHAVMPRFIKKNSETNVTECEKKLTTPTNFM